MDGNLLAGFGTQFAEPSKELACSDEAEKVCFKGHAYELHGKRILQPIEKHL